MRVKSESIHEHTEFLNEEKDIEGSRAVKKKMKEERQREKQKGERRRGKGRGREKESALKTGKLFRTYGKYMFIGYNDESISVKIIIKNS